MSASCQPGRNGWESNGSPSAVSPQPRGLQSRKEGATCQPSLCFLGAYAHRKPEWPSWPRGLLSKAAVLVSRASLKATSRPA